MEYLLLTAIFTQVSIELRLPKELLFSVCYIESAHKVTARHVKDGDSDSLGICQIKLKTARFMGFKGAEQQLMEPNQNVYWAGRYLKYQLFRYKEVQKAVIAYNQGSVKTVITSKYQRKIFKHWTQRRIIANVTNTCE